MPLMPWDEAYRTGDAEVDSQHKDFFGLFDRLHSAIEEGHGREQVAATLEHLEGYVLSHFAMEEKLMGETAYGHLDLHKGQHDRIRARVKGLASDFRSGRTVLSSELFSFLSEWLSGHIREHDMRMVQHLRMRGKTAKV